MVLLAFTWNEIGLAVAQLVLSLSILVVLHEFGHYITAKWFKCRVEKFYLFFDPWFSLVKKKVGDTEYGIGWLPLGGYVKISGMIDESLDKETLKLPPKPYEFRSKPAWQRLIIMLGGVTVNVLLAFVIWAFILMIWGDKKVPSNSLKYGVHIQDSTLYKMGLRNGDAIVAVDGDTVDDLQTIRKKIFLGKNILLKRDGKDTTIQLDVDLIGKIVENRKDADGFIGVRVPSMVYQLEDTSVAYKSGLRKFDMIKKVDSMDVSFFDQLKNTLITKKNTRVNLTVIRSGEEKVLDMAVDSMGRMGFFAVQGDDYATLDSLGWAKLTVTKYGFLAAFPAGVNKAWGDLVFYVQQFKKMLSPSTGAYKGMGGFKGMAKAFIAPSWDWEHFWHITALLSIILAFMNLLPIPALDGGHALFTLIEMITGRKPNEKFLEYAQVVGMVLLLGLMLYANGNDWFGWGRGK
ncbi:MAG: RIP metalloprotease RseP [Chitinophagaceae bacterium]